MIISETFIIADIVLSLRWNPDKFNISIDRNLAPFSILRKDDDMSHILFTINEHQRTTPDFCELIFNNSPGGAWKIWRAKNNSSYLISLYGNEYGDEPFQVIIANSNLSDFQVMNMDGESCCNVLDFPLQLVLSGYLNINKVGIFLHSAMALICGNGVLFPGMPGAGKSSISALCLQDKECEVFTDETVIIREKNRMLYAFGTPWHSTLSVYQNRGAPLHKIFFIKHGKENSLRKISTLDAANRLIVRCFPTFWHKAGMQFALDFCSRIASGIECYEFGFVPDKTAIEFLKKAILS